MTIPAIPGAEFLVRQLNDEAFAAPFLRIIKAPLGGDGRDSAPALLGGSRHDHSAVSLTPRFLLVARQDQHARPLTPSPNLEHVVHQVTPCPILEGLLGQTDKRESNRGGRAS